jgi:ribosomal protein S6
MNYETTGETVSLVEKSMKLNESIMRYLTTRGTINKEL